MHHTKTLDLSRIRHYTMATLEVGHAYDRIYEKGFEAVRVHKEDSLGPTFKCPTVYEKCCEAWAEWEQHVVVMGKVVPHEAPWAYTPDYLP